MTDQRPPDDEMLDVAAVGALLGGAKTPLSKATIWRGVKSGKFPKPMKISRRVTRWKRSEVLAVIERAAAERTARP